MESTPRQNNGFAPSISHVLLLSLFWMWQLVVACYMAYISAIYIGLSFGVVNLLWITWFFLTIVLIITIVAEIWIICESHLKLNTWLFLQVMKLAYIATVWGYVYGYWAPLTWRWLWVWPNVGFLLAYWLPWIGSLWLGAVMKRRENKRASLYRIVEGGDTERRPLI